MQRPSDIALIGAEVAVRWPDGREDYLPMEFLRARSPSAANTGERDLFGRKLGGAEGGPRAGVRVTGWEWVGGYGVKFRFDDGHDTGIYSFDLLRGLALEWGRQGHG